MRPLLFLLSGMAALVGLVGCGDDAGSQRGSTITVPGDHATIAAAVAAAKPGTTIEIGPGVYHEAVEVTVDRVTIRGTDRNAVVLDGRHELLNGVFVTGNDVAVENLTIRNYLQNGIVFNGIAASTDGGAADPAVDYGTGGNALVGYRVSYVTTSNNGLYGVYAFAARSGTIEHSYASGHPDSGFYVGQCRPCDVNLLDVVAERNAIGYYGTNASGGVVVARSTFRNNRLGIAPNSQETERLAPQADATIVGNLVVDNDDPTAPKIPDGYFGGGIAVGGGTGNVVLRNRVTGHDRAGIELLRMGRFAPMSNRIEGNVLAGNAVDLLYSGIADPAGNCFAGNVFGSSAPLDIERALPCSGGGVPFAAVPAPMTAPPPDVRYRNIPAPPPQPTMPDGARRVTAGAGAPVQVDLDAIGVPA